MTSTTVHEPRRLRADAARNRQALMDAALRLFAARGLSVTLDDIAEAAGVNVATAYRHFSNKHQLIDAYLLDIIDQATALAERAAKAEDPWEGLVEFLERTLDLMVAHRGLHDVLSPGHTSEWLDRLDERAEPLLQQVIRRGQRSGAIRKDLAASDLGVILQMLAVVTDIPAADDTRLRQRYVGLILAGLRPAGVKLPGRPPTPAQVRASAMARWR